MSPVAIIVVTWNSAATIRRCLASAQAEAPAELIVVDNGSNDDTLALVRAYFPGAMVIPLEGNTGFAAGVNRGVTASKAPYVLFLNDDAELTPGYVNTLVTALQADPSAASATGKLIYERDGVRYVDSAGIRMRRHALSAEDRGYQERDEGQYDAPGLIFGPSGTAPVYRRAAFEGAPPFDETLFAYYEDVDLAWRLGRQGWRHLYVPQAIAKHERKGGAGKPAPIAARAFYNRYRVWANNETWVNALLFGPMALAWETARLARRWRFVLETRQEGAQALRGGLRRVVQRLRGARAGRNAALRSDAH